VITTNPSVNQMVDSMYALARAWARDRNRNCGSGLSRNGSSRSLKVSMYIAACDITEKPWSGGEIRPAGSSKCEPGLPIHLRQHLESPGIALPGARCADCQVA